jgi:hypothetical protein
MYTIKSPELGGIQDMDGLMQSRLSFGDIQYLMNRSCTDLYIRGTICQWSPIKRVPSAEGQFRSKMMH